MDPTWLASLFGPEALNSANLTGGGANYVPPDAVNNLLPFATPGAGGLVPSGAPTAPTDAGVPNPPQMPAPPVVPGPPAMPTAVGPPPDATAGLVNAAKPGEADPSRILQALRGVSAPPAPYHQTITTPHPLATHPIAPGNLVNLLTSLGIGPQQLPQLSRMVGR